MTISKMVNSTTRIIVQARMGSSRLPGKIGMMVAGVPLLGRVVQRLWGMEHYLEHRIQVMVATSLASLDDETERLCVTLGVKCFRGLENDVLGRYLAASADLDDKDTVLRATADNCLYCPRRAAEIVRVHATGDADYSCVENLSYVVPEVVRVGALRAMEQRAVAPYCREHVTPYFRQNDHEFHVIQLAPTWLGLRPEIRLTVDTADELEWIRRIYPSLQQGTSLFTLEEVYEFCDRYPDRH